MVQVQLVWLVQPFISLSRCPAASARLAVLPYEWQLEEVVDPRVAFPDDGDLMVA